MGDPDRHASTRCLQLRETNRHHLLCPPVSRLRHDSGPAVAGQDGEGLVAALAGERSGTYQRPVPYTDELEASAFSCWEQVRVAVRRERSLDSVIGYLHSSSFAAPHLFGDRLAAFDDALRERLPPCAVNGVFDSNEFGILLCGRPR